jgi:putative Mn2+ efflux pump MntP
LSFIVIALTGVGLSMDAFAVALASGGSVEVKSRVRHAFRLGAAFGAGQAVMPVAGWYLGSTLKPFIAAFDHWVAFGLLVFIGLKMCRESQGAGCARGSVVMTRRRLFLLSIAVSIDALAVGVGFAFLDYSIWAAALIIGILTFIISGAGALIGSFCCCVWGKRAELLGGIMLVAIGIKILLDHIGAG